MTEVEKLAKKIFTECESDGEPVTMAEATEMAEMEIKAKGVKNYVTTEKSKKSKPREKKIDEDKKFFTDLMVESIVKTKAIVNVKSENEFDIIDGDTSYTVKIVKHRPVKK